MALKPLVVAVVLAVLEVLALEMSLVLVVLVKPLLLQGHLFRTAAAGVVLVVPVVMAVPALGATVLMNPEDNQVLEAQILVVAVVVEQVAPDLRQVVLAALA
jgi:hypothetical protein